ncbi:MAG: hypothetical protein HYZ36_08815, partial [Pedosphaera parvula]|nr:hypothetical protein [Pedosphaera parvula]
MPVTTHESSRWTPIVQCRPAAPLRFRPDCAKTKPLPEPAQTAGEAAPGASAEPAVPANQLVEMLSRSEMLRDYQKAFEDATGLPLTLRAVEGWQLAHHGNRRQNGFCAL